MKRVLVTGANGFVGHALCRRLRGRGHQVVGSDLGKGNEIVAADLRDRRAMRALVMRTVPDVIVHAGSISGPMIARDDPALVFDVNAGGTLNLLEAMRHECVPQLVHLSSIAVYRARDDRAPVRETFALSSSEPYGASKIAAEQIVAAYARDGLGAWCLRIGSIFGTERTSPYLIAEAIEAGLRGGTVEVTDETSNMRQFVHLDDVLNAIELALARPAKGMQTANITGGTYVSELQIASFVATELPALNLDVVLAKTELADGSLGPLELTVARRELTYEPRASLEREVRALASAARLARASPSI